VFGGGVIPAADVESLETSGVARVFTPGAGLADISRWLADALDQRESALRGKMHVQHEVYAYEPFLFYPWARLSSDERRRMDTYEIKIDEVTVDPSDYAMSNQIEKNF